MRRCRAFTLYEVMACVVIMGIATAVIIPQLSSSSAVKVRSATQALAGDLFYCRSASVNGLQKHYITFVNNEYAISSRANDSSTLTMLRHPVQPGPFKVLLNTGRLNGVRLGALSIGGTNTLVFDEMGAPCSYNSATNTLTPITSVATIELNSVGCRMQISIEPYCGEISVTEN